MRQGAEGSIFRCNALRPWRTVGRVGENLLISSNKNPCVRIRMDTWIIVKIGNDCDRIILLEYFAVGED